MHGMKSTQILPQMIFLHRAEREEKITPSVSPLAIMTICVDPVLPPAIVTKHASEYGLSSWNDARASHPVFRRADRLCFPGLPIQENTACDLTRHTWV